MPPKYKQDIAMRGALHDELCQIVKLTVLGSKYIAVQSITLPLVVSPLAGPSPSPVSCGCERLC